MRRLGNNGKKRRQVWKSVIKEKEQEEMGNNRKKPEEPGRNGNKPGRSIKGHQKVTENSTIGLKKVTKRALKGQQKVT